jgi:hypothetical protein
MTAIEQRFEHVVVLVMENRSFDNVSGISPSHRRGRRCSAAWLWIRPTAAWPHGAPT